MTTEQDVYNAIKATVDTNPDFVYEWNIPEDGDSYDAWNAEMGGCYYVRDDAPSCVIGHGLVSVGVDIDILSKYEGSSAYVAVEHTTGIVLSGWMWEFVNKVQRDQDNGISWGDAFKAALIEADYHHDRPDWVTV